MKETMMLDEIEKLCLNVGASAPTEDGKHTNMSYSNHWKSLASVYSSYVFPMCAWYPGLAGKTVLSLFLSHLYSQNAETRLLEPTLEVENTEATKANKQAIRFHAEPLPSK